jgi:hypothetical protein
LTSLSVLPLFGQRLAKAADDDGTQYTSIGNVGLTITNYGVLGTGFVTWPTQPSFEYPKGSGIEHLGYGGLWIGGRKRSDGNAYVSTAISNENTTSRLSAGFEMTNAEGSTIRQRSILGESAFYDDNAVSHQDFVMDFTEKNTRNPSTGDTIQNHTPLGINIHLETYAWNFPFADFFVILNYTLKNAGTDTIDGLHAGLWGQNAIRNTKLFGRPLSNTASFYGRVGQGYIDTLRLGYAFDFGIGGVDVPANSYAGVKLLGTVPFPLKKDSLGVIGTTLLDSLGELYRNTNYNGWKFRNGVNAYATPDFDDNQSEPFRGKYQRMSTMMPKVNIEALGRATTVKASDFLTDGEAPTSMTNLVSVGPFKSLAPGDSVQVVYAVIAAKKIGSGAPSDDYKSPQYRTQLYSNAGWAQQAYNGEDLNGNNRLDLGEDINSNGKLDHFTLPQPPRQPKVFTVVEDQRVTVYWDSIEAEQSFDPISRQYDFEGYRVYRSNPGAEIANPENFLFSMQVIGEFDRSNNSIGYNTGFTSIRLDTPKVFINGTDTVYCRYQFPPKGDKVTNLNGWQYLYGVSAFDRGDSANGLPSLESAKVIKRVVPGVTPAANSDKGDIIVYPNPYYANAAWDGTGERTRKIYFRNLPRRAEIKIYTLTGDLVAELQHDASTYAGAGIKWFDDFNSLGLPAQFAGGEHAWDLITKYDQAIATGLYLFTVKNLENNDIKRGKFVIVK